MIDHRLPRLIAIRYVRDHVLWLRYSDGVEGEVDLGDSLTGPLLQGLQDESVFARARIEEGHLVWPTGADWAPESLRARLGASYQLEPHSIDDGRVDHEPQISAVPEISGFYGIVIHARKRTCTAAFPRDLR
jgi:uncharacterized protein DUF2442